MKEFVLNFFLETLLALTIWGFAVVFPFRRMVENRELRWDLIAVGAVTVFALLASFMLFELLSYPAAFAGRWYAMVESWSAPALLVCYMLFADFTAYWAHRLMHTRPLWHTHAFHHSSRHLYVLSGARASFQHIVILFVGPTIGLVLFPVYEYPLAFVAVVWVQAFNQHFIHSNLRIPFARQLEYLFVTPRAHFVHHSVDRGLSNHNFGFLLSVWDRVFGTFWDPERVRPDEPIGLDYENDKLRLLLGVAPKH